MKEGSILSFLECTLTLDTDMPSSYAMLLPKLPSVDLKDENLVHCPGVPCSVASDQGTHFTANEVQQWAHTHGIPWS